MVRSCARQALAFITLCAALGAVGGLASPAKACTAHPVSIQWLADHAAQVIVCDVAEIRARWVNTNQHIESEVTLTNLDYLKGRPDAARDSMTLTFPGGTVGDTTMRLCCTPDLEVGQRWLIFLQPEYRTYPAAGMGQGIFEIRLDADATPRVFAPGGRPVTGIDEQGIPIGAPPVAPLRTTPEPVAVRGGVRVHTAEPTERAAQAEPAEAMTLDAFVQRITPTLQASRAFDLSQPAGRYIETALTSVPLARAPQAASAPSDPSTNPLHAESVPRAESPPTPAPAPKSEEVKR